VRWCPLKDVRAVKRVGFIKPLIRLTALAILIVAENVLYRRMRQANWHLHP
jgi:hypothetical protein